MQSFITKAEGSTVNVYMQSCRLQLLVELTDTHPCISSLQVQFTVIMSHLAVWCAADQEPRCK